MPLPQDSFCYFRHPDESWLWGKVCDYDQKKKLYSCRAVEHGNSKAEESRVPPVPAEGKWAGGWPEQIPLEIVPNIPDSEHSIFTVREDIVYSSEYEDTHDLLRLTILHDSTLLSCVKQRYFKDIIYTFIGAIVVAVNPFNYKIPWYTDDNMEGYLQETYPIQKNLPHSWACAHNTYHELRMEKRNQTILVSGESGAGKTEASKIVLRYLSKISQRMSGEAEKAEGQDIRSQIMAASPFLEAFGNAKTSRNDNSSRFGKFMQIKFSENGAIVGANITKYLLEKSRIVIAGPGERIYHSFYLAVRGNGQAKWGPSSLVSDASFKTLNSGGCLNNNEFNTTEEFEEVSTSMTMIGITDLQVKGIWQTLAGILHLTNATFQKAGDGSTMDTPSLQQVRQAAECFEVDAEYISQELVRTVISVRGEKSDRKLPPSKATDGRDAFVKRVYDQIFSRLVEKCNESLDTDEYEGWIGLLDIFGFEHFEVNSFEQLCINTANEALQGNYNEHVFRKDMEECRAEGVDVTEVEFPDNTPCIALVLQQKPPGLFALLDSASALSKGDPSEDAKWLNDIATAYEKHKFFEKKRLARDSFIVKHFAGDVSYTITGFIDKNADTLKDAWKEVIASSKNDFIRDLVWPTEKKLTVAGFFKQQLLDLMNIINSSNPHWIRCVKPHPAKRPMLFDGNQVAFQLTTSGVLATVSIRKAGFPVRLLFEDFNARYRVLFYRSPPSSTDKKKRSAELLELSGFDKSTAQLGMTRVFLKQDAYVKMEEMKRQASRSVVVMMQAAARTKIVRLEVWRPRLWVTSAKVVQEETRLFLDKSREQRRHRAFMRRLAAVENEEEDHLIRKLEEVFYRGMIEFEEKHGRKHCWFEKRKAEIEAASRGLVCDEERGRQRVCDEEVASRQQVCQKVQWAYEHPGVVEVEVMEEPARRKVEREIQKEWLTLLQVWVPMQLFELELGRGESERMRRRVIRDEEEAERRKLGGYEVELRSTAQVSACGTIETSARRDLELQESDERRLMFKEKVLVDRTALLGTYLAALRGEGADPGGSGRGDWWTDSAPSSPCSAASMPHSLSARTPLSPTPSSGLPRGGSFSFPTASRAPQQPQPDTPWWADPGAYTQAPRARYASLPTVPTHWWDAAGSSTASTSSASTRQASPPSPVASSRQPLQVQTTEVPWWEDGPAVN